MRRGRFGKIHLTDTRRLLWSPGGPLYLRQEPAGSCEHAPRMNRGISVFLLSTNTSRLEYPNGDTFRDGERGGETECEKKIYFQALAPGPLIGIDVRQVGVSKSAEGFD